MRTFPSTLRYLLSCGILITIVAPQMFHINLAQSHEIKNQTKKEIVIRRKPSPRATEIEMVASEQGITINEQKNPRRGFIPVITSSGEEGWVWSGNLEVKGRLEDHTSLVFDRVRTQRGLESSLPSPAEIEFVTNLALRERSLAKPVQVNQEPHWNLRSQHLLFGMPKTIDDRHNFSPEQVGKDQVGISVLVREGFVVAHFDRMKAPLWVAQRWTKYDEERSGSISTQDRPWKEDPELPSYSYGGTEYAGDETELDRGHMAGHEPNRAWGTDSSNWGVKMSNSAPQHRDINRNDSAWYNLEREVINIVADEESGISAVWTINGTIYLPKVLGSSSTEIEQTFSEIGRITTGGFGVPFATYKIVAWFNVAGQFQTRAYVFEQPYTIQQNGEKLVFDIQNPKAPIASFITPIDEVEERTGLDFFPNLKEPIQSSVEESTPDNLWGSSSS